MKRAAANQTTAWGADWRANHQASMLAADPARAWIMHLWLKGWALAPEADRALGRPAFVRRTEARA